MYIDQATQISYKTYFVTNLDCYRIIFLCAITISATPINMWSSNPHLMRAPNQYQQWSSAEVQKLWTLMQTLKDRYKLYMPYF